MVKRSTVWRGAALLMIGSVAFGCSACSSSTAPEPSASEVIATPSKAAPSVTSTVTGAEVIEHVASMLGADSLEDACLNDGIGWACNVVEIDPITPTDMEVVVTAPAADVHPAGIAMGFKNFTAGDEDSPLPDLMTVIVLNESGEELYRATD